MRRLLATGLGLGISFGVLAMLCLQLWVADIDDQQRFQRPRGM